MVFAIILGVILGIAHYLSEMICTAFSKHRDIFLSFVAGISVSYVFVELLPSLFHPDASLRTLIFLFMLLGFFLFHIFEKFIYQHSKTSLLVKELTKLHSFGFFVYHFVIGIILVHFLSMGFKSAILFFIPAFFYSLIGEVSLHEIHSSLKKRWYWKFFLALSTLLGVVLATFVFLPLAVNLVLLGFVGGALVYVVIRDSIPKEREGNLLTFTAGVVLYTFLILFLRII